jgi:chemotaxis protein CheD
MSQLTAKSYKKWSEFDLAHTMPIAALGLEDRVNEFERIEFDGNTGRRKVRIHIGEYHASDIPTVIETTLGSCIAVCLLDGNNRIGGMNHILMPGEADMRRFDTCARYGVNAMELLINRIMALGGERRRLVAKVFGGAHLLQSISKQNGMGQKNIAFVFEFLEMEDIRVIAQEVGGHASRVIHFHTDTGLVLLKRNYSAHYEGIAAEEISQYHRIRKEAQKTGEISFFRECD